MLIIGLLYNNSQYYIVKKEDNKKSSATGQITKTMKVGHILRTFPPREALLHLRTALQAEHFTERVSKGIITEIIADTSGGFDTGTVVITGEQGEQFKILY